VTRQLASYPASKSHQRATGEEWMDALLGTILLCAIGAIIYPIGRILIRILLYGWIAYMEREKRIRRTWYDNWD
jgi:hypothetical protein